MRLSREQALEFIYEHKIIVILRGVKVRDVLPTAKALYEGGIRMLEITFLQDSKTKIEDTSASIRNVTEEMADKMLVGAGTVMSFEEAKAACEAGASYILSPNTNIGIIEYVNKLGAVPIPGAFTPTEIAAAFEKGAPVIKLFPAGCLGVEYIKAIRAPISHIPLLAVGGVTENNMDEFLKAGVKGFGIGSSIAKNSLIEKGDFEGITKLARLYTNKLK